MKFVALAAALLVLSYVPKLLARLSPSRRKELGRTVLAVAAAAGLVMVFRHLGVILAAVAALAYYLGSGGAAQGFREWFVGTESRGKRVRGASPSPTPQGEMTRAEALEVLGLQDGATREEVLAQYRVLIKKVHPDRQGGSEYLAMRLNKAKDALLG